MVVSLAILTKQLYSDEEIIKQRGYLLIEMAR
jgi:hypothetical protein